jgi:peptide/nickel transport system substrate-binding protein
MRPWSRPLLLAAGLALAAQAPARAAVAPDPNATLVYYDMAGNETLDPVEPQNNSSYSHEALLALYEPLIRLDDAGNPAPGLAASWTRNEDLTEITLKLRPGVTFHDGTKLNAAAVKRNFDRMAALGGRAGTTVIETFKLISAVEYEGEDTVRIKLKSPNGQIEYWLGSNPGMMVSPASLTEGVIGAALNPVGAGPYRLKSFEANVKTITSRFDNYWNGTKDRPAGFEHHYVPDGRARLNALRSGQANIALIDPRQIPEAKGAGLAIQVVEKNALWLIYPNLKKGPLGDLRVRKAIMHAIDREGLAEALTNGSGKPTWQMWSSRSPYYVKELENAYPYDPAKAKALLAEAGFKDGFELTDLLLNNSEYRQVAEALQANLADVGIRMKFDVVDVSQFTQFYRPPTKGDVLMGRYGGRSDPIQTVHEVVGSGGSYAPGGVASPRIDELIGQARRMSATDPNRAKVMQDLSREISASVATMPMITRANVYASKPGCILNLEPYLPSGDDRLNDVQVAAGCK